MLYRRLGRSGLRVPVVCIGTMPFGSQVDEAAAYRLLDRAWDGGINFVDTAEMYASPPTAESYGLSETIIGNWVRTKPRDAVLIATKIAGPNDGIYGSVVPHIRGGSGTIDAHNLATAVEGSLRRLRTDYVDLYQTHWPDRITPHEVQLEALDRLVCAGKVRYIGVSNETPWGLTRLSVLAAERRLPRPIAVQNLYNLLERTFEGSLAEVCLMEGIGMIAYSPLAMGILTGKYSGGASPPGTRLSMFDRYRSRYGGDSLLRRADHYARLAREAALDPAAAAIAWVRDRPGVTAVLSSCTREDQVDSLIAAATLALPEDFRRHLETETPLCGSQR